MEPPLTTTSKEQPHAIKRPIAQVRNETIACILVNQAYASFREGQFSHENNEHFTPRKLHAWQVSFILFVNAIGPPVRHSGVPSLLPREGIPKISQI